MSKKSKIEIIGNDYVKVICVKAFKWKYDKVYRFEFGQEYEIPTELYSKIKHLVKLASVKEIPAIEIKEQEDGE